MQKPKGTQDFFEREKKHYINKYLKQSEELLLNVVMKK